MSTESKINGFNNPHQPYHHMRWERSASQALRERSSAKLDDGCWTPSAYRSGEEFFNECQHIVQEVGEGWVI